jgi:RNA polymerase sigma-70 factor (ECF subfamily)
VAERGEHEAAADADPRYVELRRTLVRAVRSVCPRWLGDRADDVVQEAMLKVIAIMRRGEGNAVPSASYLRKVAWTATVDEIRRRRARPEESMEAIDTAPAPAEATDAAAVRGELVLGLRACLDRIVVDRRRAVALHLAGYSIREVADALGWAEKRAENLVYRGLADLRACLEGKGLRP